ncbi:MAG TPA: DNA cytosine methyltransferase, partial [Thermoanaerobaculaceae bacterium]|nr:DNA cytosine methyltransferase [Thermoanaerobaculaceae bacterium]
KGENVRAPSACERVIVIGSREGTTFRFPAPTHGEVTGDELLTAVEPLATAWDAIGDLEADDDPGLAVRGRWAELLPSIPEGENYLFHTDHGQGLPLFGWRRRFWSFLLKLAKGRPSWTIQAQPGPAVGPFHWRSRRLSVQELGRLQTLPEGYRVLGNLASVQRQLGNAVPSALGEVLARAIRRQLLGDVEVDSRPTLIPARRLPVPGPEPVRPVPERYLHLVGEHAPHPGTGQGYAASERRGTRQETPTEVSVPRVAMGSRQ